MVGRPYKQMVLLVTTVCDLECPQCCYREGYEKREDFDVDEILAPADLFQGMGTIYLSGGEPTLHPKLPEIIEGVRDLMKPKRICLATNGLHILDHWRTASLVDWVMISGISGGAAYARRLRQEVPGLRVTVEPPAHREVPLKEPRAEHRVCPRIEAPIYVAGRLYPCCVAYGIPSANWIEPREDWVDRLRDTPPPCRWCGFSPRR